MQLCEDKPPNQLYFGLESQICDEWSCSWVPMIHAHGSITMECPGYVSVWRSSKLRWKSVWCW